MQNHVVRRETLGAAAAAIACAVLSTPVAGQCAFSRVGPVDVADLDYGDAVAIDGDIALVGAPAVVPEPCGIVYAYHFDGAEWVERQIQADPACSDLDWFGRSVALDGHDALIGAAGAAYWFRYDAAADVWVQMQELTPPPGVTGYGRSVALSGAHAVVGSVSGQAFVHELTVRPEPAQELVPSDVQVATDFGYAVAIDGDVIVVGAPKANIDGDDSVGAAYVFRFDGTAWPQESRLVPSSAAVDLQAGFGVAVSGNRVAVGAPGLEQLRGAAYVFENDGSTWVEQLEIVATDGNANDLFGFRLALHGSALVVGAEEDDDCGIDTGSVYVYDVSGPTPFLRAKLLPFGQVDTRFGSAVAVAGVDRMVVGAGGNWGGDDSAWIYTGIDCDPRLACPPPTGTDFDDEEENAWLDAVTGLVTIDFTGLDEGTVITDEFEGQGVLFTGEAQVALNPNFLEDGVGLAGQVVLEFDPPRDAVATIFPAQVRFELFREGELIYESGLLGNFVPGAFAGVTTAVPFDRAVVVANWTDDLLFGTVGFVTGDATNDGVVNLQDLLAIVGDWGPCPAEPPCLSDLDGDGTVGIGDLLIVIANWT